MVAGNHSSIGDPIEGHDKPMPLPNGKAEDNRSKNSNEDLEIAG